MVDSVAYEMPNIKRLLDAKAYHLGYQGGEIGWSRDDALMVISELEDTQIGILGGDVWQIVDGKATHAYDNWHSDPGDGETLQDFAVRSRQEAGAYIRKYPESGQTFYVLVFNQ